MRALSAERSDIGEIDMAEGLRDIRELQDDKEAYHAELDRRWAGLLSYRYIGRYHGGMNGGDADPTVPIRHDLRNEAGGLMAAPIAISSPEGCQTDLVVVPNPVISSVQIVDPGFDVAAFEVLGGGVVHQGRKLGYGRSMIVDADDHDRLLAVVEGQGAVIGVPPEGLGQFGDHERIEIVDSPDLPPLWEVFGAYRRDDGLWGLPELQVEFASPDAALHIGPQHVVLETAAIDFAASVAGTRRLQVTSWHVMFMARGKVGPFRVEGTAHPGVGGRVAVRMLMHDEGNGDRAVTTAACIFEVVA